MRELRNQSDQSNGHSNSRTGASTLLTLTERLSELEETLRKSGPTVRAASSGAVRIARRDHDRLAIIADNRGGVTSLLRTHFFRQTGRFSMVFTASDVCGASPNQQALRTFCLLRASFPLCSF